MAPESGEKKLGQPVPLSNFRSATNSWLPHPAHEKVPARCSRRRAHEPGRSVACSRRTAYCSGVRIFCHSSSVLVTGYCSVFIPISHHTTWSLAVRLKADTTYIRLKPDSTLIWPSTGAMVSIGKTCGEDDTRGGCGVRL